MSKSFIKQKDVPELRFPEFSDKWKSYRLGKFANINPTSKILLDNFYYIDLESVKSGQLIDVREISKKEAPSRAQRMLQKGDILFQTVRPYQKNNYFFNLNGDFVASTGFALMRTHNDPGYLYHFLHNQNFVNKIIRWSTGTNYPAINSTDLKKSIVNAPSAVKEQKKIAEFLTNVDNFICNLKKQEIKLKDCKRGLMQKIFSQEVRFKEKNGHSFPDWQTVRLGKIIEERAERAGNRHYDLLSVTMKNGVKKYDDSVKKDNSSGDKSNYKVVRKNDIAYNTMRMWQGASGVSSFEGIVSPAYTVVAPKAGGDPDFFGYLFKQPRVVFDFYRYSQGLTSDTWNLKFKHFKEIKVTVPTSKDEQVEISNFLKSIDELIEFKSKQIEKAETWKRGLLQKMFV